MSDWGFETRQIHAGAAPDPTTGARATPIYQTTSYTFRDTAHAAALFGLAELGNIYTRIMNPTQAVFEERIAALEGGVAALAVSSGQAAESIALLNLAENGGHVVSSASLYGGTYNLFHYTLPKLGVEVTFVDDPDDLDDWRAAIRPNTKAFYAETLGNPKGDVLDFAGVSGIAHEHKIPLVIDNTLATPYLCNPLGPRRRHRRALGDQVHRRPRHLDRRRDRRRRHLRLRGQRPVPRASPSPTRATTDWSSGTCPSPLFPARFVLKARLQYLRDLGAAITPFNSFLFIQGVETLSLRMERHVQNAAAVASWLEARDEVTWVAYPGLASSPWHARQQQYLPRGGGAILAFGIEGGADAGRRFIEGLELFSHLANVGDVRSLAIHPASTTHSQLTEAEQVVDRGDPGPGPPVHRHRVGRGHPGRPRARVRRRQGGVTDAPAAPSWQPGDDPGGRRFARLTAPDDAGLRLECGGTLPERDRRLRDVGDPRRGAVERRARPPRPHRRQPRRRAGRPRPPDAGMVGRADRPGPGHRHRPVVRRLPQRARAAARGRPVRRRPHPTAPRGDRGSRR